MIIPVTLLFGAIGFLFYKSKKEVSLIDDIQKNISGDEEDSYEDLEDLFI